MINHIVRRGRAALVTVVVCFCNFLQAGDFYVAMRGTPSGNGSPEKPWDLKTALGHPRQIRPGDTIWIEEGTYRGSFTSTLSGSENAPITVRAVPGQKVKIICEPGTRSKRNGMFEIRGDHSIFWGLEIAGESRVRTTDFKGNSPPDIIDSGIDSRAAHVKLINLLIHDTSLGINFWADGEGGEINGCIIFNNGWRAPHKGCGHGIYTQNEKGTKLLIDNVIFNQFGYGIHAYGSKNARLKGFHIEGNASFNNGSLFKTGDRAPNLHVGGGSSAAQIVVVSNYTYHSSLRQMTARFGYAAMNDDLTCRGNYFVGFSQFERWSRLEVRDNSFIGLKSVLRLEAPEDRPGALDDYVWNWNNYIGGEGSRPGLSIVQSDTETDIPSWADWQRKSGFDVQSKYSPGRPSGLFLAVRPNYYEKGRANIIVYNWDRNRLVDADVSNVLTPGRRFRLYNAQNMLGDPVLTGEYKGKPLSIPMEATPPCQPIGMDYFPLPVTAPEFQVFVLQEL